MSLWSRDPVTVTFDKCTNDSASYIKRATWRTVILFPRLVHMAHLPIVLTLWSRFQDSCTLPLYVPNDTRHSLVHLSSVIDSWERNHKPRLDKSTSIDDLCGFCHIYLSWGTENWQMLQLCPSHRLTCRHKWQIFVKHPSHGSAASTRPLLTYLLHGAESFLRS